MQALAQAPTPHPSKPPKAETFDWMMGHAQGGANAPAVAGIYASWRHGDGAMPDWLGLDPEGFRTLLGLLFPGLRLPPPVRGRAIDSDRRPELAELVQLMLQHRAHQRPEEALIAGIIAAGCLGEDHLWQDLGLFSRPELTALITRNFPALAARNQRDMKWKRFLYKQLCETEGIYTCRAPSCDTCTDYAACFGPES
jgi:nitrogen fixation protein NifQ